MKVVKSKKGVELQYHNKTLLTLQGFVGKSCFVHWTTTDTEGARAEGVAALKAGWTWEGWEKTWIEWRQKQLEAGGPVPKIIDVYKVELAD